MSITIDGVPESLTRQQYTDLIAAVGFDPHNLASLTFSHVGIHAVVFARGEDGKRVIDEAGEGLAKHDVFIPVKDEDAKVVDVNHDDCGPECLRNDKSGTA